MPEREKKKAAIADLAPPLLAVPEVRYLATAIDRPLDVHEFWLWLNW
ncbi:hypothetical protein ABT126_20630 [Streptomyces sp. NPDC002012]